MDSEESGRKAKIIVLSIILAVVVIFIIVFATIQIVKLNKKNAPPVEEKPEDVIVVPEEPKKPSVFSNSYNEAITRKILTDDSYDYKGTYTFVEIGPLIYSDELTAEEKQNFWTENNCRDANDYKLKVNEEKLQELKSVVVTIDKPINEETGSNEKFGIYTYTSDSKTLTGKVYGDRNLAVLVQDNTEDTEYYFISLNYTKFNDAVDVAETTHTETGTIYLFENYYKDGKLFYSLTYIYKVV